MKITLTEEDARGLAFDDHPDFEVVDEIAGEPRRWSATVTTILKHSASGKHYAYQWQKGNTEYQEHEFPSGEIDLPEMVQTEVVVKEWKAA